MSGRRRSPGIVSGTLSDRRRGQRCGRQADERGARSGCVVRPASRSLTVVPPDNEVASPTTMVADEHLGRPCGDTDTWNGEPDTTVVGASPPFPHWPTGAEPAGQSPGQTTTTGKKERLVDRLGTECQSVRSGNAVRRWTEIASGLHSSSNSRATVPRSVESRASLAALGRRDRSPGASVSELAVVATSIVG